MPLEQGLEINLELVGVTPWALLLLKHLLGDGHWLHARVLAAELGALLRLLVYVILDAVKMESMTTVVEPQMLTLLGFSITFVIIAVGLLAREPLLGNEGASTSVADQLLFLLFLLNLLVEVSLTFIA